MHDQQFDLESREQLAQFLKISIRSIDNLVKRGCPSLALSPRCRRFNRGQVLRWLESGGATQSQAPVLRGRGRPRNVDIRHKSNQQHMQG